MTIYDYINNKNENPYVMLQRAKEDIINMCNERQREKELEDRIVNRAIERIMFMVDTGQAMGKVKELNDAIKSIGK